MTLPPGLQAIRERAEHYLKVANDTAAVHNHSAIALDDIGGKLALLDLIETLAGALDWLTHLVNDVGKAGGRPEPGEFEAAEAAVRAALTKYREFGQQQVERET